MKLKFYLLIACLAFSLAERASAQAIIGNSTTPKDYATLEIAGTDGGLRLPYLTTNERDALDLSDGKAAGLVIYNKTENCMQFWSGIAWATLKKVDGLELSRNGISSVISGAGNNVQTYSLGGNLTRNTTVDQGSYDLSLGVTTGKLAVNNSSFVVNKDGVGIGVAAPAAALDINGTFRYSYDGQESKAGITYALTADEKGNANWQSIAPNPVPYEAAILDGTQISSMGTTETPVPISQPFRLTKGIYMIMARYVAISDVNNASGAIGYGYNSWLRLRKSGDYTDLAIVGQVPQKGNGVNYGTGNNTISNQFITTPQLVYILTVPVESDYILYGDLVISGTGATDPQVKIVANNAAYGQSYFRAIRLTE